MIEADRGARLRLLECVRWCLVQIGIALERALCERRAQPVGHSWQRPDLVLLVGLCFSLALMPVIDMAMMPWLRAFPSELRTTIAGFSWIGEGVLVLVVSGLMALAAGLLMPATPDRRGAMALVRVRDAAGAIFVTVAVSGLMAAVLKNVIGRARPNVGEGAYSVRSFAFDSSLAAFPSGHAATGAAIAVVFGLLMPRYRWALMWIGALVCASRVLLGAHWVSDVVAGWTVGMAVTLALSAAAARRGFAFRFDRRGRLVPRGHVRFVVAGLGRLPVGVWAVQAQAWVANRVERWRGAWDQRTRAPWLRVRQVITRRRFG